MIDFENRWSFQVIFLIFLFRKVFIDYNVCDCQSDDSLAPKSNENLVKYKSFAKPNAVLLLFIIYCF